MWAERYLNKLWKTFNKWTIACIMEEGHKWLHIFKINVTNNKTEMFRILASVEGWLNYQLLQGGDISFSYVNCEYGSLFPMVVQTIEIIYQVLSIEKEK